MKGAGHIKNLLQAVITLQVEIGTYISLEEQIACRNLFWQWIVYILWCSSPEQNWCNPCTMFLFVKHFKGIRKKQLMWQMQVRFLKRMIEQTIFLSLCHCISNFLWIKGALKIPIVLVQFCSYILCSNAKQTCFLVIFSYWVIHFAFS